MVAANKNVTKSLRMQQFNTSGEVAMGKYPDRHKSCGNATIYNCEEYGNGKCDDGLFNKGDSSGQSEKETLLNAMHIILEENQQLKREIRILEDALNTRCDKSLDKCEEYDNHNANEKQVFDKKNLCNVQKDLHHGIGNRSYAEACKRKYGHIAPVKKKMQKDSLKVECGNIDDVNKVEVLCKKTEAQRKYGHIAPVKKKM